jgi:putative MATE family efflux protein
MDISQNLREEKISKLLLKFSIPAILAMLVTSFYNTVDRAFIGSIKDVGAFAISGLGVTMPLFTILGAFCVAIAVGGSTNISIKLGERNKEDAERILGNTVALELIVGIVIVLIGIFYLDEILYMFGASEYTIEYARDYMSIIFAGAWFNLPGYSLNSAIRAEGNPKLASTIMIFGCILNIILDPLLIFGFNLGIKGAAIGTVICQLMIFIWSSYYFTFGKSNLKLKFENIRLEKRFIKPVIVIALTPLFMELAAGFIHLITNRVLKDYGGDLAIGAMTAITSISLMFLMPIFGLSQGMQTIIAYNYGAKQPERTKTALFIAILVSIIILSVGLILIKLYPKFFVGIFTNDDELLNIAINGININLATLPIIGISILGSVYFQSIGKVKISMFLSLLRQVIILIPIIMIIPRIYGLSGVWISQPIADFGAMAIVIIFLIREFK